MEEALCASGGLLAGGAGAPLRWRLPPAAPPALEASGKLFHSPLLLDRQPCRPKTGPLDCSPASLLGSLAGSLRVISAGGRQSVVHRFPWGPPELADCGSGCRRPSCDGEASVCAVPV